MFTTGTKFFLGATVVSFVAAIAYGVSNGGGAGWMGTVGLLHVAFAFAFLAGMNIFVRDGNVPGQEDDAGTTCSAAQPPVSRSMWPAMCGLGLGLLVVGAETRPIIFSAGVIVLLAGTVEWMVLGWSERASTDAAFNAGLRKRILHPIELPVLGALGLAVVIYSFSRIMLFLSKADGPFAFIAVGALILIVGSLFAARPGLKRGLVFGVCAIGALGLISAGAVAAIDGEREIHRYPTTSDEEGAACTRTEEDAEGDEELEELDDKGSQAVAAKSNAAAEIVLENGVLSARIVGFDGPQQTITIPRSNPTNIIFSNRDDSKHRMTAYLGTVVEDANGTEVRIPQRRCTVLVEEDGQSFLTLVFPKSSAATPADDPYTLTVPGIEGQQITVIVP